MSLNDEISRKELVAGAKTLLHIAESLKTISPASNDEIIEIIQSEMNCQAYLSRLYGEKAVTNDFVHSRIEYLTKLVLHMLNVSTFNLMIV
jgi:hypothetical protein